MLECCRTGKEGLQVEATARPKQQQVTGLAPSCYVFANLGLGLGRQLQAYGIGIYITRNGGFPLVFLPPACQDALAGHLESKIELIHSCVAYWHYMSAIWNVYPTLSSGSVVTSLV